MQMQIELDAGPVNLSKLFGKPSEFISPLFQRRYVWASKEIRALWDDIEKIRDTEESSTFLGALVFEIKSSGKAFKPDEIWIIDGQQRLTTLYCFLLRFAIELDVNSQSIYAKNMYQKYLFNDVEDGVYAPRLHPTILDNHTFNTLFQDCKTIKPKLKHSFGDSNNRLAAAYKEISKIVKSACSPDGDFNFEAAEQYVEIILNQLKFIQISLGDKEQAHQVFDSLNSKGTKLENGDLIRNIVFAKVYNNPEEANNIYNWKWLPLEKKLGQHFEDYFFPFTLIHKPTITKTQMLSELRKKWKEMTPEEIVDDLEEYLDVFMMIVQPTKNLADELSFSSKVLKSIYTLHRMKILSSVYPYLMRVLNQYKVGNLSESTVVQMNLLLESFMVRRSFAGFEPTGLHALFKNLWEYTKGDPRKFIEIVEQNKTVQFPSDLEFVNDIKYNSLYGRKLASFIILEYERSIIQGDIVEVDKPSIDHVVPKVLDEQWAKVFPSEEHKEIKDTWANLVPLSSKANSEKSRKSWKDIQELYRTETIYKTTKKLAEDYTDWNLEALNTRAEVLSSWAVARWPKDNLGDLQ
ncbi:MAG: DUF262 domain-containing HNH endonuclease family protein [bacterium]